MTSTEEPTEINSLAIEYRHYSTNASFYMVATIATYTAALGLLKAIEADSFLKTTEIAFYSIFAAFSIVIGLFMWRWVTNRKISLPLIVSLRNYALDNKQTAEDELAKITAMLRRHKLEKFRKYRFMAVIMASAGINLLALDLYSASTLGKDDFSFSSLSFPIIIFVLGTLGSLVNNLIIAKKFNKLT